MGLMKSYFGNTRKPSGILGKMMLSGMNREHAAVSDWGLTHIDDLHPQTIAELGCGGGRNAAALLQRFPSSQVVALDYSEEAVQKTADLNRDAVASGRCRTVQGDVSHMPLDDGSFDLACAFETVYFWPGPTKSFAEVSRILKPGGIFLIVNESDGTDPGDEKWKGIIDGLEIYTADELGGYLREAGFAGVRVDQEKERHWLCLRAQKQQ